MTTKKQTIERAEKQLTKLAESEMELEPLCKFLSTKRGTQNMLDYEAAKKLTPPIPGNIARLIADIVYV